MGSRKLEREGYQVIRFDARGHGESGPEQGGGYTYESLAADALAVLRSHGIRRAVVVGVSMGAHTAVAMALANPNMIAGLVLITPAFDPTAEAAVADRWSALADGLKRSGIDGFIESLDLSSTDERWRDTVALASRQRMERHTNLGAIEDALRAIPMSRPFDQFDELESVNIPATVVASRDQPDPTHPEAVGRLWADALPNSTLLIENQDDTPLAWRGAAITDAVISTLYRCGFERPGR
jgi:pimeloyl-ACP methyl ester carboxylesterase